MNGLTLTDILGNVSDGQALPSLFISHGAPTIAIEDTPFTQALHRLGQTLPKPKLIVMMSAHWESRELRVNANPAPRTWHDFGGFPDALFQIQYPVLGYPQAAQSIANQLAQLGQLEQLGVAVTVVDNQPFDHGVWTPLLHMYPKAEVPIVQVSLPQGFDTSQLYRLGQLFAPLRQQGVLIVASGSITHNLYRVRFNSQDIEPQAKTFKDWMIKQLADNGDTLFDWESHELARHNHPTPEHLLPVFFARGAGALMSVVHESFAHYNLGMDIYRFD